MYRSSIYGDDEPQDIADCLACHVPTYTFALKNKYHEDKGKDFEIVCKIKHIITFECGECNRQYRDEKKIYEQTMYANTGYHDIDPEPEWKCPDHPNATGCLLIEDVEDGWKDQLK